ncbi:MAG: hypothetical protein OIF51_07355 [Cellvibrionaceae bacterium]|nr:hypothetical protein [Cellvibrionaceae bacterium]
MKYIFAIALTLISCIAIGASDPLLESDSTSRYQTYIQIDKSSTEGKYFFLVIVEHEQWETNNDIASATFLLAPGESAKVVTGNKLHPSKKYIFNLSVEEKGRILGALQIEIFDEQHSVFKGFQKYAVSPDLAF